MQFFKFSTSDIYIGCCFFSPGCVIDISSVAQELPNEYKVY